MTMLVDGDGESVVRPLGMRIQILPLINIFQEMLGRQHSRLDKARSLVVSTFHGVGGSLEQGRRLLTRTHL